MRRRWETYRLVESAHRAQEPGRAFTGVAGGILGGQGILPADRPAGNLGGDVENILAPHRERTMAVDAGQRTVL